MRQFLCGDDFFWRYKIIFRTFRHSPASSTDLSEYIIYTYILHTAACDFRNNIITHACAGATAIEQLAIFFFCLRARASERVWTVKICQPKKIGEEKEKNKRWESIFCELPKLRHSIALQWKSCVKFVYPHTCSSSSHRWRVFHRDFSLSQTLNTMTQLIQVLERTVSSG